MDCVTPNVGRIAVVWRGTPDERPAETRNYERLRPVFDAFSDLGVVAVPVLYCDQMRDPVRDRLLRVDGVLVWVDPISGNEVRTTLDAVLRDVSSRGVWVSAHPDAIEKMGTKEVLYRTKRLGWGADTHLYTSASDFRQHFPDRLGAGYPRVLKQNRGNGGIGVWKVALANATGPPSTTRTADTIVRIQHAAPRDDVTEDVALGEFMDRCEAYFVGAGKLIDQPFVKRLADGMIRAYLVRDEVVGFAHQQPTGSIPSDNVLGMPSAKTMFDADNPTYEDLRTHLECEWVRELQDVVALKSGELPLIWDADFLYGSLTDTGADTYVLCEINVSSVLPFPPRAPHALALAVQRRLT